MSSAKGRHASRSTVIKNNTLKLIAAIDEPNNATAKRLIEAGVDVNWAVKGGETLITKLLWYDDPGDPEAELIGLLIDRGADPNKPNSRGETPIFLASTKGAALGVEILLKAGADPNNRSQGAAPLLHISDHMFHPAYIKTAKLLTDAGADVNITDELGNTPLSVAMDRVFRYPAHIYQDSIIKLTADYIRLLAKKGADVNRIGRWGVTPLYTAAKANNPVYVKLLLDLGASTLSKGRIIDKSIRQLAAENEFASEINRLILEYAARENAHETYAERDLHIGSSSDTKRSSEENIAAAASPRFFSSSAAAGGTPFSSNSGPSIEKEESSYQFNVERTEPLSSNEGNGMRGGRRSGRSRQKRGQARRKTQRRTRK